MLRTMFLLKWYWFVSALFLGVLMMNTQASIIINSSFLFPKQQQQQRSMSGAAEYLKPYWKTIPPSDSNDPCEDFSKYVCPPSVSRSEASNNRKYEQFLKFEEARQEKLTEGLFRIYDRPDFFGVKQKFDAEESIVRYWKTKYTEDDAPAWQSSIKSFFEMCESYFEAGGISDDSKFANYTGEIKDSIDTLLQGMEENISKVIAVLQKEYGDFAKFPWNTYIHKSDPAADEYAIVLNGPFPTASVFKYICDSLEPTKTDPIYKQIREEIISKDATELNMAIQTCKILQSSQWVDGTPILKKFSDLPSLATSSQQQAEDAGFCKATNTFHKNFDIQAYLNEHFSTSYDADQYVYLISDNLMAKIMSILCMVQNVYNNQVTGSAIHNYLKEKITNKLKADLQGDTSQCASLLRTAAPDLIAYEANHRALANNYINNSLYFKLWESGVMKEKVLDVYAREAQADQETTRKLQEVLDQTPIVMELPRSGTDYIIDTFGPSFPKDIDYFPKLYLETLKYNSRRSKLPAESGIVEGFIYLIDSPAYITSAFFPDVPRGAMYIGPYFASPPLFDATLPKFIQYSSTGWILAHETIHALEKANGTGFQKFKECLTKELNKVDIVSGNSLFKVDGEATLDETFADVVGLKAAKLAYEVFKDSDTVPDDIQPKNKDKLFLMSAAISYVTCNPAPKSIVKQLAKQFVDPHVQGGNLVNEVFKLWPTFGTIFGCAADSAMAVKGDVCSKDFKIY